MDMTMSSIRPNRVGVFTSVQRRRRWTPEQKLEIVKQTNEQGSSVSLVARQHGLTAAQLFHWRKAYLEGSLVAVGANETVFHSAIKLVNTRLRAHFSFLPTNLSAIKSRWPLRQNEY